MTENILDNKDHQVCFHLATYPLKPVNARICSSRFAPHMRLFTSSNAAVDNFSHRCSHIFRIWSIVISPYHNIATQLICHHVG